MHKTCQPRYVRRSILAVCLFSSLLPALATRNSAVTSLSLMPCRVRVVQPTAMKHCPSLEFAGRKSSLSPAPSDGERRLWASSSQLTAKRSGHQLTTQSSSRSSSWWTRSLFPLRCGGSPSSPTQPGIAAARFGYSLRLGVRGGSMSCPECTSVAGTRRMSACR